MIITNSKHYKDVEKAIRKAFNNYKEPPIGWYNNKPVYEKEGNKKN